MVTTPAEPRMVTDNRQTGAQSFEDNAIIRQSELTAQKQRTPPYSDGEGP